MQQQKFKNLLSNESDLIAGSLTKCAVLIFDTLKNIINNINAKPDARDAPRSIYQSEHELIKYFNSIAS